MSRSTSAVIATGVVLCLCAGVRAYVPLGYIWAPGPIVMQLHVGSSGPLTDGSPSWDASAAVALSTWNVHTQQSDFAGVAGSTAPIGNGNGFNNVFWSNNVYGAPLDPFVLAVTTAWIQGGTRRVEGDVIFNNTLVWNSYSGNLVPGVMDFRRVALHEFGHVLGLHHPDQFGQSVAAIMNSTVSNLYFLTADDIAGANALYGIGCTYTVGFPVTTVLGTGATWTATVSAPGGCTWTASSSAPWLTVTSGSSGSGNGAVGLTAAANLTNQPRVAVVTIAGRSFTVTQQPILLPRSGSTDFDGDSRADIGVFRRSTGEWFIIRSSNSQLLQVGWGVPALLDTPVPADYDGDGRSDVAVFRGSTGEWFIIRSSNSQLLQVAWGVPSLGDVPVPADYDGDGRADIAVYRTTTGEWFIIRSSTSTLLQVAWGSPSLGDLPVVGDYDGDNRADVAVYRLSTGQWFIIRSSTSTLLQVAWGVPQLGDIPVVGDYDNDGRSDIAVYRQTTAEWFVIRSSNSTLLQVAWGTPSLGDIPVPADYDGDGRTDVAVFRRSTNRWFIIRSTNSTLLQVDWGNTALGDWPVSYP